MSKLGGPPGLEVSTYRTFRWVWTDVIPAKAGIQSFCARTTWWGLLMHRFGLGPPDRAGDRRIYYGAT